MPGDTIDEALASIPANYRLYTVDASIEGRFRVMLVLTGQDRQDWFDVGEVLDKSGRDIRPSLYQSGVGPTLAAAIMAAVKEASDAPGR